MNTKPSKFQLIDFLVERSLFQRKPLKNKDKSVINISPSGILLKDQKVFQLILDIVVSTKSNRFNAEIRAIGIFAFHPEEETNLDNFFYLNAPAILFPYVRAYITGLTALSGLGSEIIPTLNMSNLSEILKSNTTIN